MWQSPDGGYFFIQQRYSVFDWKYYMVVNLPYTMVSSPQRFICHIPWLSQGLTPQQAAANYRVKIKCDYCGDEIKFTSNEINLVTGYVGQGTDSHACTMKIELNGVIPYCTGNADICVKCATGFLKQAINKINK